MNKNITISLLAAAILSGCGSDSTSTVVEDIAAIIPVVNSAPKAMSDTALVQNNEITTIDVLANDTDEDDDQLTISSIINQPQSGTVEIVNNQIVYTPQADVATSETITYEVSDGELTAEASIEVTVNHTMTLSGLVTDSPIANALVSITIGDDVFEVEADAQGNYTLPITINDMSALIFINAKGNPANGQENVELIAVAGKTSTLLASVDDNRQLTNDENNTTNVTHVSTATYLLVKDRSESGEIANEEEFNELAGEISTEELIETAGFIKLLVDNTDFEIPEGETVLSILDTEAVEGETSTTSDAIEEYLVESELVDENGEPTEAFEVALEAAVEETISDPNVVEQFNTDSIAGKVMIDLYGAKEGWNEYSGTGLNFSVDGTGKSYSFRNNSNSMAGVSNFTWAVVGGGLNVVYLDGFYENTVYSKYPYGDLVTNHNIAQSVVDELVTATDAGLMDNFVQLEMISGNSTERSVLLASTPTSYQVNVSGESFTELTLPAGVDWKDATPRTTETFSRNQILVHTPNSAFIGKTIDDLAGDWVLNFDATVTDYNNLEEMTEVMSDLVTIKGTVAVAQFAKQEFTASLNEGVLALTNKNVTYKFTPFSSEGKGHLTKIEKWLDNELEFVVARQIAQFDDSSAAFTKNLATELPQVHLAYINGSIDDVWDGDKLNFLDVWGYHFAADGTLNRGISGMAGENSWDEFDVDHFYLGDNRWIWDTSGRQVNMYRVDEWNDRHRTWEVISVDEQGRALVFEHSVSGWDRDGDGDIEDNEIGQYIRPRINTIMLDDLSRWEDEWQTTIDVGLFTPIVEGAKTQPTKVTKKVTKKQREIPAH
ncbi:hypothetical protein CXF85_09760 [Colwellia sp. 75C3]|uniref:Ig-like domain-containing protein n=1 Tax=Colwellia sp. 75C3 TaxID=888425 RepID=UPI000C32C00E|nr:Ig-like domain-containing protein [Colwellia sp. 75C3]PKG83781.1 hypothetical protein CXF85_09760 [Colwellia sp. 75C3]